MTLPRELDHALLELVLAGTTAIPPHAQSPERIEAIRRLVAHGLNDRAIGERLRMTRDAVCKTRERHAIPAGVPRTGSSGEPTWWSLTRGRHSPRAA